MLRYIKRLVLVVLILSLCVGCDQTTKIVAKEYLALSQQISFVGDTFRFQYTENPGAFLSFGSTFSPELRFWVLTVVVSLILAGILVFVLFSKDLHITTIVALSLILGGGSSNLIDRWFHNGVVVDFMNIGLGEIRTGIFNFADVFIMVGFGLFVLMRRNLNVRTYIQ
jgi:signal peptidase II